MINPYPHINLYNVLGNAGFYDKSLDSIGKLVLFLEEQVEKGAIPHATFHHASTHPFNHFELRAVEENLAFYKHFMRALKRVRVNFPRNGAHNVWVEFIDVVEENEKIWQQQTRNLASRMLDAYHEYQFWMHQAEIILHDAYASLKARGLSTDQVSSEARRFMSTLEKAETYLNHYSECYQRLLDYAGEEGVSKLISQSIIPSEKLDHREIDALKSRFYKEVVKAKFQAMDQSMSERMYLATSQAA